MFVCDDLIKFLTGQEVVTLNIAQPIPKGWKCARFCDQSWRGETV